jgi:carboxypeptidase Taq
LTRVTALAQEEWIKARKAKDFAIFLPSLEKVMALTRQSADYYGFTDSPYDALLDGYEQGMKASDVRRVFAELREGLVPLVKAIAAQPETDDACLHQDYDEQKQWQFAEDVIKQFGYDFNHGRQDRAPHPYCTTFGLGDVRLTARVLKNFLPAHLMGSMHEAGHGMYQQGVAPALARSTLFGGASLGIHESQSRMWENLVGRSRGFWGYYYPKLQAVFPDQLGGVDLEVFYKAINKVKPSFIRGEADEVTYNLHTLIRFEIEVDVLEGRLAVKDIPGAWNAKYKDYLGLEVPDDSLGCLQDVHWSFGLVAYFPTYTLGNIISVQLWEKALAAAPTIPADIARGEFSGLLTWLRENIHQHGCKFTPTELLQRVTGGPLNSAPYIAYLKRKYSEIYGL